jgi:hypothetical protein
MADKYFMSAVSATNTGVADLMQIFSSAATPALSSLLTPSKVQSALRKASPTDLVQLSERAMQLQEVDGLFGTPAATETQSVLMSLYSGGSKVNLLG